MLSRAKFPLLLLLLIPHLHRRHILRGLGPLRIRVLIDVLLGMNANEVETFGERDTEQIGPNFGTSHVDKLGDRGERRREYDGNSSSSSRGSQIGRRRGEDAH